MYLCYCLVYETMNRTYVGCTNNFPRRIRQHNCEIKGGAKYTSAVNGTSTWKPIAFANGFVDNHEALSFEWHWKFETRKLKGDPIQKRLDALDVLLRKPRFSHITHSAGFGNEAELNASLVPPISSLKE